MKERRMGRKEWAAIAIVIGGGILLQIPGHDAMEVKRVGVEAPREPAMEGLNPGLQRVELHVTGMT